MKLQREVLPAGDIGQRIIETCIILMIGLGIQFIAMRWSHEVIVRPELQVSNG